MTNENDNLRYILFLGLPKKIEKNIGVVRKNFQSKSLSLWPSHITIKYDENFILSEKEFLQIVMQFYKNVGAITVTVGKPKIQFMRDSTSWNIYLPVSSRRLKTLIRKFSKSVEEFVDKEAPGALASTKWEQSSEFQPHISLKGGIGRKEGIALYEKMRRQNFGNALPCDIQCRVVTVAKWGNKRWNRVCDIALP